MASWARQGECLKQGLANSQQSSRFQSLGDMMSPNFTSPGFRNNSTYSLYDFFPRALEYNLLMFKVCIYMHILGSPLHRVLRPREIQWFAQYLKTWDLCWSYWYLLPTLRVERSLVWTMTVPGDQVIPPVTSDHASSIGPCCPQSHHPLCVHAC